jgi:outer membrane protein
MKQLKLGIAAFAFILATSLSANAQKIGYIDPEQVMYALPEIAAIQAKLDQFSKDSVGGEYDRMMAEYKRLDSTVTNSKIKSVTDAAQKDRDYLASILTQWQQVGTEKIQAKQAELLRPLYKKVIDATNAVSKEKGYIYVLNPQALVVAPPGDDLTPAVAAKLGIKLPEKYKPGIPDVN